LKPLFKSLPHGTIKSIQAENSNFVTLQFLPATQEKISSAFVCIHEIQSGALKPQKSAKIQKVYEAKAQFNSHIDHGKPNRNQEA